MRFVKILLTVLLVAAIGAVSYFLLNYYNALNPKDLTPIYTGQTIPFDKDENIHFHENGFIITGDNPRFYNGQGTTTNNPFTQNDLLAENGAISIKHATDNYICTESDIIYDTSVLPFKRVFENIDNISIYDMKNGIDFFLLLIEVSENIVEPYLLINNTDILLSYDGRGDTKYISSSIYENSKDVSILSVSLDTTIPITRIFNYSNRNEAYGVITVEDQFLYDIYRMEDYIILIGTDTIMCYNINGEKSWTVENPSRSAYESVYINGELLLYFNDNIRSEIDDGNTLKIYENGDFDFLDLPKYISSLHAYNRGYVAVELGNTIIVLDHKGQPKKRYRMDGLVRELYVSEYHEDMFYIKAQDNTLEIYTNQRKDEQD